MGYEGRFTETTMGRSYLTMDDEGGGCLQRIRYRNETFSLHPSRVTVSYGRTTGDSGESRFFAWFRVMVSRGGFCGGLYYCTWIEWILFFRK